MVGCADLKYFNLTHSDILDQEFHILISKFPLLEKLVVQRCYDIKRVVLSSNQLKELRVIHCFCLTAIDVINVPSLLTFYYQFGCRPAHSINSPCSCQWKIGSSFDPGPNMVLNGLDRIKKIMEMPYDIEELRMSIYIWHQDPFTLVKFKKRSPSPPREVGNLTIDVRVLPPSNYAALLDCLLWICYPRIFSIKIFHCKQSTEFIMWLYEKMTKRDAKCCNRHGIKCWQHYLKDFKIESFIPFKDPKPLHIDNLMAGLPKLPQGTIRFCLDWCFSEYIDGA
ncbi:hypothetical protein Dsin_022674 [Dipteronia sinensis]|uniref:At1g61320/AtMIF1 LRR domain-containing protein n=1 Tax=Dipteronia sinensis TaxID=43782 RepID=A0AAE0A2Y0_9ROSI|nr:hypothetical protein Dsin_022674 [Dipteronia sinensis]